MDKLAEDAAVVALSKAATTGIPVAELPMASRPVIPLEALAIQDRIVRASGKVVAGWKVATTPEGIPTYGAIYAEDCFPSPAAVPKNAYPLMGIEGEVAFRFLENLPVGHEVSVDDLRSILAPFPAFEVVNSRFLSYAGTPPLLRLADRMSNGAMVIGEATATNGDLGRLPVTLSVNGEPVVDQIGGHSRGDPFLPVVEFIHAVHLKQGFEAGQFITAGTFTGLRFGNSGEVWELDFEGLGQARLSVT